MIEISYNNVMNGLNQGIHMSLICPTQCEADRLFRNGLDLWYIPEFSTVKKAERSIEYGYKLSNGGVSIRFKCFNSMRLESWKGFRGVFLMHPALNPEEMSGVQLAQFDEMNHHNVRYLEQWQS